MLTKGQDEKLVAEISALQVELIDKFDQMCKLACHADKDDPIIEPFWHTTALMMKGFVLMLDIVGQKHL